MSAAARRRVTVAVALTVVVLALSLPGTALACPVCFDPKEAGKGDFLKMTVFMSLLPLTLMGSVGFFVWTKLRARDSELAPAPIPIDRHR